VEVAPVIDGERNYDTVQTWEQFDTWLARINAAELTAFDTETTALDPMLAQLVGISLSVEPNSAAYIPVGHRGPDHPEQLPRDEVLAKLKPWLESAEHKKVGQHMKYDEQVLANYGIAMNGIEHDTLLQSYVLESHRTHDMDSLALRHLGIKTIKYEEVAGKGAGQIGFDEVALEQAANTPRKTPTSRCVASGVVSAGCGGSGIEPRVSRHRGAHLARIAQDGT
jgi:DNA polymerase-1